MKTTFFNIKTNLMKNIIMAGALFLAALSGLTLPAHGQLPPKVELARLQRNAEQCMAREAWAEAIEIYEAMPKLGIDLPNSFYYDYARALEGACEFEDAKEALSIYLNAAADEGGPTFDAALAAYDSIEKSILYVKEWTGDKAKLPTYIKAKKGDLESILSIADYYRVDGIGDDKSRKNKAIKWLEEFLYLDLKVDIASKVGLLYYQNGDSRTAYRLLDDAMKKGNPLGFYYKGSMLAQTTDDNYSQLSKALAHLMEADARGGSYAAEKLNYLGLLGGSRFDFSLDPPSTSLSIAMRNLLGESYEKHGRWADAVVVVGTSFMNGYDVPKDLYLARLWLHMGAVLCSEQGDNRGLGAAYNRLSKVYYAKGDYHEALRYADLMFRYPNINGGYYNIGPADSRYRSELRDRIAGRW